jgi:S1-C subfamily serine protease
MSKIELRWACVRLSRRKWRGAAPLSFVDELAPPGTDAIVMGYPGGGDFTATPARIRETIELNGPDIYRKTTVTREVYTIRGTVRQGNSGGPMINRGGKVLGVVFGAAVDDADTGFVLTSDEVGAQLAKVGSTARVPTGVCVS